jgi:hypothetical protein
MLKIIDRFTGDYGFWWSGGGRKTWLMKILCECIENE